MRFSWPNNLNNQCTLCDNLPKMLIFSTKKWSKSKEPGELIEPKSTTMERLLPRLDTASKLCGQKLSPRKEMGYKIWKETWCGRQWCTSVRTKILRRTFGSKWWTMRKIWRQKRPKLSRESMLSSWFPSGPSTRQFESGQIRAQTLLSSWSAPRISK